MSLVLTQNIAALDCDNSTHIIRLMSAGHLLASQQIDDSALQENGEAEQALRQSMQPLVSTNNTAVLECDKLAPAHSWLVQGDVKVEVQA